jgi:signal transduction histidine kinase
VYEIKLYEVAQTETQYQVSQDTNQQIYQVKQKSDALILAYEQKKSASELRGELAGLNTALSDMEAFILNQVEAPILDIADENSDAIASQVAIVNQNLLYSGIITLGVFIFAIFFIQRSIIRPLSILQDAAKDFGRGEFYTVSLKNKDELGLFAETFTNMGDDIGKATSALEVELDKTRKLDQQKSEFLAVAAHQLRTPVSGIKWLLKMLFDGDLGALTKDQTEQIGKGLDNADRMVRVVNDLLQTTRVSQPRYAYEYALIQPAELVVKVAKQFEQNAAAKQVILNVSVPEKSLPQAQLDKEKIELMITNLLDNAIKYNFQGKNTWISLVGLDKNHFQIIVKDEGYGIPKDQQDQVYKKFFRGRNVVQIDTLGSGLGLAMVKDIVDAHEGAVKFESIENQGTTFWVTLPYIQSKPEGKEVPTFKTIAKKLQKEEAPVAPQMLPGAPKSGDMGVPPKS